MTIVFYLIYSTAYSNAFYASILLRERECVCVCVCVWCFAEWYIGVCDG